MESIWKQVQMPRFDSLEGEVSTDVLIIGGGIAGILCAHFLQEKGVDYLLAEGRTICSGVTGNTTAKLTVQHGLIYDKMMTELGEERAQLYLDANQAALDKYFELCQGIDCDFSERRSAVYSLHDRQKLEREADALRRLGQKVEVSQPGELPFSTVGAVFMEHQAQFHPLKFLAEIARGLHIYEHSFVTKLARHLAVTEKAQIRFQKVIFATHFPIDNKHGMYFVKMYQNRSYVIALQNAPLMQGMYRDESQTGLSFRSYGDFLLLGGGAHRTGKQGGNWRELREVAGTYYPHAREAYCWAAQDCMTLDGLPYIGAYSPHMPGCYVVSGFEKWGMTQAMAAAMMLTDMILEKETPYEDIFYPSRRMRKKQLLANGWESLTNLLTPTFPRCPHLGCALKWNSAEHSWDCPCHGSRFTEDGKLLDNPANGDF